MKSNTNYKKLKDNNLFIKNNPFKIKYGIMKVVVILFTSISAGSFIAKNMSTMVKYLDTINEQNDAFSDD
uniref:Exported protein n=1 Tax=Strongyloides venezuelensis TaxID=75913 RepID=A0A0K0FU31_STRVS